MPVRRSWTIPRDSSVLLMYFLLGNGPLEDLCKVTLKKYSWTGLKTSYNGIVKEKKLMQLEHSPLGHNYCISSGFLHLKSYLSQKVLATLPWLLCVSAWDIPEKYSPYKSYFIRWCHPQSFKRAVLITCLYDRSKNIITKPTLRKRNIVWRQAKTVAWWLVAHVFLSFLVAPKPEIVVARLMSLSTGSCGRRFHPEFASNRLFFNKIVAYQESVFPEYPRVYRARATTNAT